MKLPTLIKRDPVAALAAARAKLTDIEAELVKLDAARAAALVGSDEISDVQEIDDRRAGATRNAAVLKDRIGALALAIRVQRAEQREKEFQAGLAIVAERLKARVELARKLDGTLREFEDVWNRLLDRTPIISNWPEGVTRPRAEDLLDIKPLRLELAWRLYSCGRPRWDHPTSVPPPQPAMGVEGLQPAGLIGATEAMGRALFARLRAQGAINPDDNTEEEFAA